MSLGRRRSRLACSSLLALAFAGCGLDQEGIPPPPATLNTPIALGLSRATNAEGAPRYLFVVNSNFDVRYNDGTLMALDLDAVAAEIEAAPSLPPDQRCGAPSVDADLRPCQFDDVGRFLADEVGIGSHADGLVVATGASGERLYVPSRSNRNLVFVDFEPGNGTFSCGADDPEADIPRCGDLYRQGAEGTVATERELVFSGEPVDVGAGPLAQLGGAGEGNFVLLATRQGGVALFVEDDGPDRLPTLADVFEGIPEPAVTLALQPGTNLAWITTAESSALSRVGVVIDREDPLRSFLYDAGSVRLTDLDAGDDNRDLAFDPDRPGERAFVLSRSPESVVTLDLTRADGEAAIEQVFEVGAGASRLAVARLEGDDGRVREFALASTFNARKLFVIDVQSGAGVGLVAVIGDLSGPFALAVDTARRWLYIADFSVSVIRVVDLSPLTDPTSVVPPSVIATIGKPAPVQRFGS